MGWGEQRGERGKEDFNAESIILTSGMGKLEDFRQARIQDFTQGDARF